jgi:hypothetical protein
VSVLAALRRISTLPLREGRQNSSGERSERAEFFGEGLGSALCPSPKREPRFDPPSRGGWDLDSSCFVLVLGLSSQNDHNTHHLRCPPRRAPRGGFARTAQAARPQTGGEGGGGGGIRSRNYVAEAGGRPARQSQRLQTWPPLPRDAGAEGRDPAGARQTAQSLRGDRHHAQTGRQPERAYARFAGRRPVAGRLERRLFFREGGGR